MAFCYRKGHEPRWSHAPEMQFVSVSISPPQLPTSSSKVDFFLQADRHDDTKDKSAPDTSLIASKLTANLCKTNACLLKAHSIAYSIQLKH